MTSTNTNEKRAAWAQVALDAFQAEVGGEDTSDLIADLISDLGHVTDSHGIDFVSLVEHAVGMWSAESRASDGEPDGNDDATLIVTTVEWGASE